jgi:arsenate reductase
MGFRTTAQLEKAIEQASPEMMVTMGCGEECPLVPGCKMMDWDFPDPAGQSIDVLRNLRDLIEKKVIDLISEVTTS